tara:strand:- start:34 stop:180 length:147 start_codon:yes stop_codon:yes gene_type:complete
MEYFLQSSEMQKLKIRVKDRYIAIKMMEFIANNYLILSLFLIFLLIFI